MHGQYVRYIHQTLCLMNLKCVFSTEQVHNGCNVYHVCIMCAPRVYHVLSRVYHVISRVYHVISRASRNKSMYHK